MRAFAFAEPNWRRRPAEISFAPIPACKSKRIRGAHRAPFDAPSRVQGKRWKIAVMLAGTGAIGER